jgi:hypothetical protein
VHVGETQRVREIGLGKWIIECVLVRDPPDDAQTCVQFAEEVGDPLRGRPPAEVDEPLAQHGLVDERAAPERPGDAGAVLGRGMSTTLEAEMVSIEWSIGSRMNTARPQKTPGTRNAGI